MNYVRDHIKEWDYNDFMDCLKEIKDLALKNEHIEPAIEGINIADRQALSYVRQKTPLNTSDGKSYA